MTSDNYPWEARHARALVLDRLSKRNVARAYQSAGSLMSTNELMRWTKEQLVTDTLNLEFGDRPTALPPIMDDSATTGEGA